MAYLLGQLINQVDIPTHICGLAPKNAEMLLTRFVQMGPIAYVFLRLMNKCECKVFDTFNALVAMMSSIIHPVLFISLPV